MALPNQTVFEFYEGSDRSLYTDGTGQNLNQAPAQLLANDIYLSKRIPTSTSYLQTGVLESGMLWMADASSGPVSRETPVDPTDGEIFYVKDDKNTVLINTIILARTGGVKIQGLLEDMTLDVEFFSIAFVYNASSNDWRLV